MIPYFFGTLSTPQSKIFSRRVCGNLYPIISESGVFSSICTHTESSLPNISGSTHGFLGRGWCISQWIQLEMISFWKLCFRRLLVGGKSEYTLSWYTISVSREMSKILTEKYEWTSVPIRPLWPTHSKSIFYPFCRRLIKWNGQSIANMSVLYGCRIDEQKIRERKAWKPTHDNVCLTKPSWTLSGNSGKLEWFEPGNGTRHFFRCERRGRWQVWSTIV